MDRVYIGRGKHVQWEINKCMAGRVPAMNIVNKFCNGSTEGVSITVDMVNVIAVQTPGEINENENEFQDLKIKIEMIHM